MIKYVEYLGSRTLSLLSLSYDILLLLSHTLISIIQLFKPQKKYGSTFYQLLLQIYFTGIQAFLLVCAIATILGIVIVYVSLNQMPEFGIVNYFSRVLINSIVVELSPLITALVIIGRSSTALTVYLGNMKVNKEISALQSIGVSYIDYLVMPSFLGFIISLIVLSFYFSAFAIGGGLIFASLSIEIPFLIFIKEVYTTLVFSDIIYMVSKSIIFGLLSSLIAVHYGLAVKNIRQVPQVVIKTVVTSVTSIIVFSLIFAWVRYGI